MIPTTRRAFCLGTAAGLALAGSPGRAATGYPQRPVRIIVPYAAGGGSDVLGRLVAHSLADITHGNFIVDNVGGAGGSVGLAAMVRAPADGYTLALISTSHATNAAVMKLPYDVVADTRPVGLIARGPWILATSPKSGIRDLPGLLEMARRAPGRLNYASSGPGSSTHLATELFAKQAGISIAHVPYRSTGLALVDLLADRVQLMMASAPAVSVYIADNRLKALGVSTAQRSPLLPGIPTLQEQGVKGYNQSLWHALAGPRGTPEEVIAWLNGGLAKALATEDMRVRFGREGLEPQASTPKELGELLKREVADWSEAVRGAGIKLE